MSVTVKQGQRNTMTKPHTRPELNTVCVETVSVSLVNFEVMFTGNIDTKLFFFYSNEFQTL